MHHGLNHRQTGLLSQPGRKGMTQRVRGTVNIKVRPLPIPLHDVLQ